jgi:Neocarzinostatin family
MGHDDFPELDAAARAASQGLHDHILQRIDPEVGLGGVSAGRARRRPVGRFLITGAAVLLIAGAVVTLDDRGPGPSPERDLPTPVALTPLGPRDGKASIGLPVSAEPNVGLVDGASITATGSGFQPGESVAIVQCALEAGRPAKGGEAAGVDGCDIDGYTSLTASTDGVASGTYLVRQRLTTPATGTVDCGSEPGRCIIAMAAISDYDRSGGAGLTFGQQEGPGPTPPVLIVEPSVGLTDAQVVHVTATGLTPNTGVELQVCSDDPAACWSTAAASDPSAPLLADAAGGLSADVPVWRYLPGPEPRSYVDCAVSVCNLWVTPQAGEAPAPVRLGFLSGGDGPTGPALVVEPDQGIVPGAAVSVRGAGFEPGATLRLSLCIGPVDDADPQGLCVELGRPFDIAEDGTLDSQAAVPGVAALGGYQLSGSATTTVPGTEDEVRSWPCDGVSTQCVVRGELAYGDEPGPLRPRFGPDPVPVTYAAQP